LRDCSEVLVAGDPVRECLHGYGDDVGANGLCKPQSGEISVTDHGDADDLADDIDGSCFSFQCVKASLQAPMFQSRRHTQGENAVTL
jgi:hypothetical protein